MLIPLITGTWAKRPAASAVPIGSVNTLPSTTPGIAEPGKLLTRVSTGTLRRHCAVSLAHPTCAGELFTEGFGVRERYLVQRKRTALDDRALEESA